MFRILQLQRSIRCLTSVRSNLSKTTLTHQTPKFYSSNLAAVNVAEPEVRVAAQENRLHGVLSDIQKNLRLYGRISNKQLVMLSQSVSLSKNITSAQALAAIRCFTDVSVDSSPSQRIENVNALWNHLEALGVPMDVSHYNALLRVYLDSNYTFNPTEFLSKMAENGVGPNRITYQFLVERYCSVGDVTEAARIMRFMEEKQVPISLGVLNLMIMGHARNNDMESARDVLNLMKSKGFTPDDSTYGILLAEYARIGDVDSIVQFLDDKENTNIFFDSRTVSSIIYQLCVNNHCDAVGKVLNHAPRMVTGEFHRLVHRLASAKYLDGCLALFDSCNLRVDDDFFTRLGTYVISRVAPDAKSAEELLKLAQSIPRGNTNTYYLSALKPILGRDPELALSYMDLLEKQSLPMKSQYFFPLVAQFARNNDYKGLAKAMVKMRDAVSNADVYILYRIFRAAGWNRCAAFHGLLPVRSYSAVMRICFRQALIHRQLQTAQEIAALKSSTLPGAADALVYSSVLGSCPAVDLADLTYSIVACSRGRGVEASDSDADAESGVADASAETPQEVAEEAAEDAAEEVAEDKRSPTVQEISHMTPQQLIDFLVEKIVTRVNDAPKLTSILREYLKRGLFISKSTAEKLSETVELESVKELLQKLSSQPLSIARGVIPREDANTELLTEYLKADVLQGNKSSILTEVLLSYASSNDRRLLDIYKELGDAPQERATRAYVHYVCRNDSTLGLECYRKYSDKANCNSAFIHLARLLIVEGKIDEALKIISDKQEYIRSRANSLQLQRLLIVLSACPNEKAQEALNSAISDEDTAKNLYIRQLNTLAKRDPEGAVNFYEKSFEQYGRFGFKNLAIKLVEEERYELLQKLQNVLTEKLGEDESLYELALVLLRCHKVPQARRIIEMSNQLARVIARLVTTEDPKSLENLLEIIPPYHPRKDDICEKLLIIYDKKNDAESALALWSRFEEESYCLPPHCLKILGDLLKRCNYELPFEYPTEVSEPSGKSRKSGVFVEEAIAQKAEDAYEVYKTNQSQLRPFLAKLDPNLNLGVRSKLVARSILEEDRHLLKLATPANPNMRFDLYLNLLNDNSLRESYVKMMHSLSSEVRDMIKAYWLHSFIRGDERTCKALWKRFSLAGMLIPPLERLNILDDHKERYWKFLKEIEAPSRFVLHALVRLLRDRVYKDIPSSLELVEENAVELERLTTSSAAALWNDFRKAGASLEQLKPLDNIMEKIKGAQSQTPS